MRAVDVPYGAAWYDAHGRPVNIEQIDKRYALNILTMVVGRIYVANADLPEHEVGDIIRNHPLVQRLRETVLNGRDPDVRDRARAVEYNELSERRGIPFKADLP